MPRVSPRLVTFCATALLWLLSSTPIFASPSPHEIYDAMATGRLDLAQVMVNGVLRENPLSARAHYLQAHIFAKEGAAGAARAELSLAETLAPGLPDENPRNVEQLRHSIAAPPAREGPRGGAQLNFPLGLLLAAAGLGCLLWRRTRSASFVAGACPCANSSSDGASSHPSLGETL